MKILLLKLFKSIGLNSFAKKIFITLDMNKIALSDIKYIISITDTKADEGKYRKYCESAIKLFQDNSLGYIKLAELEISLNNNKSAKSILLKSPKTKIRDELLQVVEKKLNKKKAEETKKKAEETKKKAEEAKKKAEETKKKAEETKKKAEGEEMQIFENVSDEIKFILNKLVVNPLNIKYQTMLLEIYEKTNNINAIKRVLGIFDVTVQSNKTLSLIFRQVSLYQKCGDYITSYSILTKALKKYTGDRRILFRLGDILKFDRQVEKAYIMYLAGEIDYPTYGAIRRLSFEVDNKLFNNANQTLSRILDYSITDLTRYISMINRVSAYLPEHTQRMVEIRTKVEKELEKSIYRSEKHFNTRYQYLLQARFLNNIEKILDTAKNKNVNISDETSKWFDKINSFMYMDNKSSFLLMINLAHKNESNDILFGLDEGVPIAFNNPNELNKPTVELFIPNSIFTNPANDKSSFETVNMLFKNIFLFLLAHEDIIIIPRHQYNWRYAKPRTDGKIISYHTNAKGHNADWLHVQESTFVDHCSVDSEGFAGFASISHDFSKIDTLMDGVSKNVLDSHHRYLTRTYVENNLSKYTQENIQFTHKGKYVFVALQVMTDIVADLAYIRGVDLVDIVAKAYENTDTVVVVKRHPYCNSMSLQKKIEDLVSRNLIVQTDASIHSIIKNASVVYTVNSGVGLEALIHLKPVVVTGECDYSYAVNSLVKTDKELLNLIQVNEFTVDTNRIKKFLYFYTKYYIQDKNTIRDLLNKWLK